MALSDTARIVLSMAAQHPSHLVNPPAKLPAAARNSVFRSLLKRNMLTEINAPREYIGLGWRQDEEGTGVVLRITDEGMRAIGIDPNEGMPGEPDASGIEGSVPEEDDRPRHEQLGIDESKIYGDEPEPAPAKPASLRAAAEAAVAAWDQPGVLATKYNAIQDAMDALRRLVTPKPARAPGAPRTPREGTKQEAVLALLRRPDGASGPEMVEATGWAPHTVRGFLAGLQKKGLTVTKIGTVRKVGPNQGGAKGSFSTYRVEG